MENQKNVRLAPPWIQYLHKLAALFGNDPEIKMDYNEDENILTMRVENGIKADAIAKLLPSEKEFGNVTMKINVVPANTTESKASLYRNAFNNNPVFAYVFPVEGVMTNPITYVVFRRKVVQYYDDNLADVHGNRTTLCQDIAKEILDTSEGVYFCTDNEGDNIGRPLGEWP